MKKIILFFGAAVLLYSCQKNDTTVSMGPGDYLVKNAWTYDTLRINLPATYAALSLADKTAYQNTDNALQGTKYKFEAAGTGQKTVTVPSPATTDFTWKLINANADIEITAGASKDTLKSYIATELQFSYVHFTNGSYNATYIFGF